MRLYQHAIVSGIISGGLYAASHSPALALSSFAAGVLIDFDHVADYWLEKPFSMNVRDFFVTCERYGLRKTHLLLHSFELLLLLGLAGYLTRSPWVVGLTLGWAQHLFFDQLMNYAYPGTYFFTWRLAQGFDGTRVFDVEAQRAAAAAE